MQQQQQQAPLQLQQPQQQQQQVNVQPVLPTRTGMQHRNGQSARQKQQSGAVTC
jgi:hypothetical protein